MVLVYQTHTVRHHKGDYSQDTHIPQHCCGWEGIRKIQVDTDLSVVSTKKYVCSTYSDLYKEVPQVFLEGGDILVEVDHALNCNLDLVLREVREGSLEQVSHKALHESNITGAR